LTRNEDKRKPIILFGGEVTTGKNIKWPVTKQSLQYNPRQDTNRQNRRRPKNEKAEMEKVFFSKGNPKMKMGCPQERKEMEK
jgi:hypothetical protein